LAGAQPSKVFFAATKEKQKRGGRGERKRKELW